MSEDGASSATSADNSSFVEHLRLVHFTLIAACLIISIAITSQPPSSAARAYEQTNQLLRIRDIWQSGEWLRNFVAQQQAIISPRLGFAAPSFAPFQVVYPPESSTMKFDEQVNNVLVRIQPIYWRPGAAQLTKGVANQSRIGTNALEKDDIPFDDLAAAIRIWNRLDVFRSLLVPTKMLDGWLGAFAFDMHTKRRVGVVLNLKEKSTGITPKDKPIFILQPELLLREDLITLLQNDPYISDEPLTVDIYKELSKLVSDVDTQCFFFHHPRIVLRAECGSATVSPQSTLANAISPTPPPGDFSQSFPDIDDLAKHLAGLSLQDLQTFFRAEKDRSGDKIELPGVKLPGEAVTSWGVAILLVIEGYFCVVFRETSQRLTPEDKAWNVPWIGISRDGPSGIAFVLSMLVVIFTLGYLGWRGIHFSTELLPKTLYGVAFLISVCFVAAVFSYRRASVSIA